MGRGWKRIALDADTAPVPYPKAQNMIIPLWSEHQRAEASKYSSTSSSVFPLVSGRSKAATKKYTTVNQENKKNMDE
jgi:hypothetical protein